MKDKSPLIFLVLLLSASSLWMLTHANSVLCILPEVVFAHMCNCCYTSHCTLFTLLCTLLFSLNNVLFQRLSYIKIYKLALLFLTVDGIALGCWTMTHNPFIFWWLGCRKGFPIINFAAIGIQISVYECVYIYVCVYVILHMWVSVKIMFWCVELLSSRGCTFIILTAFARYFSGEVIIVNIPTGKLWEFWFPPWSPAQRTIKHFCLC